MPKPRKFLKNRHLFLNVLEEIKVITDQHLVKLHSVPQRWCLSGMSFHLLW